MKLFIFNICCYIISFWLFSLIQKKIAMYKIKKMYQQDSKKAEDDIDNFFNNYDKKE